jgi:opacity protein-like surface antigen
MKKLIAAAALAAMTFTAAGAAQAASQVQVGVLSCDVDPGVGLIFGSSKDVTCKFTRKGHKTETYHGAIDKLGIDLGITGGGKIAWLVFAATKDVPKNALAGTYVGASAEASLGVGLGGNWLIGGSKKSIALQPWSVTGTIGVNWSWTWTRLTLK